MAIALPEQRNEQENKEQKDSALSSFRTNSGKNPGERSIFKGISENVLKKSDFYKH
jgi:hypothetical protein